MPFVYGIAPTVATFLTSSATPNTEALNIAIRQATRGVDIQAIYVIGKGSQLTSISGLGFRLRRWTTVGTGGTAITPAPRRIGTTASTTAASSEATITAGTVSGAYQLTFGCGAGGPGGWVAPNPDSVIHIEGGSSDEIDINSQSATASLNFDISAEIAE
jgi:hypothetical protein